jgi:uncharacterized membrane protein YqjE
MMGRIAAVLVLISQVILVWIAFDLRGRTAIWFTFVGHPLLAIGLVLGLWAMLRRLRRERLEAARVAVPPVEAKGTSAP